MSIPASRKIRQKLAWSSKGGERPQRRLAVCFDGSGMGGRHSCGSDVTRRAVVLQSDKRRVWPRHASSTPVCGGGRGGGGTQFAHGRGRMTIDPRIHTIPPRSTSGFHQPGRHCLHQARSAVRRSASRMKGEMHPSKNRS